MYRWFKNVFANEFPKPYYIVLYCCEIDAPPYCLQQYIHKDRYMYIYSQLNNNQPPKLCTPS